MEGTHLKIDLKGKGKETERVEDSSIPITSGSGEHRTHFLPVEEEGEWTGGMASGRSHYSGTRVEEDVPRKAPLAPHYQDLTSGINRPVWFERGLDAPEFPMLTT